MKTAAAASSAETNGSRGERAVAEAAARRRPSAVVGCGAGSGPQQGSRASGNASRSAEPNAPPRAAALPLEFERPSLSLSLRTRGLCHNQCGGCSLKSHRPRKECLQTHLQKPTEEYRKSLRRRSAARAVSVESTRAARPEPTAPFDSLRFSKDF